VYATRKNYMYSYVKLDHDYLAMVVERCEEKRGFELKEDMELDVECDPGHILVEHANYRS
jgi:hypothetical protein